MVLELCFKEHSHVGDTLWIIVTDVFHTTVDIILGLLIFGLLGTQLLFYTEILLFGLLYLGQCSIVSQASLLELLAGGLVFFHLHQGPL